LPQHIVTGRKAVTGKKQRLFYSLHHTLAGWRSLQEPGRPSRFPSRLPCSQQELLAHVDRVLAGLQDMLQEHTAEYTAQLRMQVVRATRLSQRLPTAALSALSTHLLLTARERVGALLLDLSGRRADLEARAAAHKAALRPAMARPSAVHELDALAAAERTRAADATMLSGQARAAAAALAGTLGEQAAASLAAAARALLAILDAMPTISDVGADGQASGTLLSAMVEARSLPELCTLASAGAASCPLASQQPCSVGGRPGTAAATWSLAVADFSAAGLGWSEAGGSSGAGDKQGTCTAGLVTAADSPAARNVVAGHAAAVATVFSGMASLNSALRSTLDSWVNQEDAWAAVWALMLAQLRSNV
jgi:Domain of unknown function (DUF4456)